MGDWGGKPTCPFYTKAEKSVAAAMGVTAAKISSKFTIGLGDNFYYNGVTCVNDPRFQTTFEVHKRTIEIVVTRLCFHACNSSAESVYGTIAAVPLVHGVRKP